MDLVTIQTFDNFFRANIQLTRLRAAGVECYLRDEYTVTIDPLLSNAIGGIKLQVRKEEEQKARQVLFHFNSNPGIKAKCPLCGSQQFVLVPAQTDKNMGAAIEAYLFSEPAVPEEYVYKCTSCGYESENLTEINN